MNKALVYKICGYIGILGSIAVVAADIIGIALHEEHNPISNTISMLAIGKYGWIQDLGLVLLSVGYLAIGFGLYTFKKSGVKWIISLILLLLISIDIFMIAVHNQYAGRPGENIHYTLAYSLAGMFLILNFLIRDDLKDLNPSLKKFSLIIGVLWLIFAPLLPLIPDNFDGAYERLVCSLLVIWPVWVSYQLIKQKN
ncbi:DUF998 domain-containing protein [Gramella sp. BOM4]|nr:DUF998 domain-containing protein [Christiangramia bathymodioli]